LYPDTTKDWNEIGVTVTAKPNIWLCDFCPVHSLVLSAANSAKLK
jgi:hypothetical protein